MAEGLAPNERNEIQKLPLTNKKGSGAFGEVFKVLYKGKSYAIKKLNPAVQKKEDFLREVTIHTELSSNPSTKNSVPILYGAYERDGSYFIVMEYLEGLTLRDLCTSYGKLPKETIDFILSDVKKILKAFHSIGIVFLDLNKDNIFIEIENNTITSVKLIDFGMSKKVGDPGWEENETVNESMNWERYTSLTDSLSYCEQPKKGGSAKKKKRTRKVTRKTLPSPL